MKTTLLIALASLLLVGGEAQAQMARQEFYPVQSTTLSDVDFLNGKKEGVPVTLAGALRLPKLGPESCRQSFCCTAPGELAVPVA